MAGFDGLGLFPVEIDVYKKHKVSTINAHEDDANGRGLLVTLLKDGVPFNTTGIDLKLAFRNAIGEERLFAFSTVDLTNGKYSVTYPREMLEGNGGRVVRVEIKAYDTATQAMISYSPLNVYVSEAVVTEGQLVANSEGSEFVKLLERVETAENAELLRVSAEGSRVSAESGRVNAEVSRVNAENARASFYSGFNAQLEETDQRIDAIITTPVPTGEIIAQEIIDARDGEISVGAKVRAIDAQLAETVNQIKSFIDVTTLYEESDVGDYTNAFNKAIATGRKILIPSGTYPVYGVIDFSKAPMNSYNVEGIGDNSVINLIGSSAKLYDKYGNQGNIQYHIKSIKDFKILGDGTNIGFDFQSLQMNAKNITIFGCETGLKITDGYGSSFDGFKFGGNIFDIKFGAHANGIEISNVNIDGHSDTTGAAIQLDGNASNLKIHGIIESIATHALWYTENFSGQVELELYLEMIGNGELNKPAIRNDSLNKAANVTYANSKFQLNSILRSNGGFELGLNPKINNSMISDRLTNYDSMSVHNCLINSNGTNQVHNPIIFSGLNHIGNSWGQGGSTGVSMQLPAIINDIESAENNVVVDPFSDDANNLNILKLGGSATIINDTTTKFGKYNSTKISFVDGVIGSSNVNSFNMRDMWGGRVIDVEKLIAISFVIKANKTGLIKVRLSGPDRQLVLDTIKVDTNWRKFIFIGKNFHSTSQLVNLVLFAEGVNTDFNVNMTALHCYANINENTAFINEMLQGKLNY